MEHLPIRVMIVDDHPHAREGMREIIQADQTFIIVAEASNGEEAVQLAAQLLPDLILMDIKMPGMNGMEAVKMIKTASPAIKIVMVTVSDDIADLFEAIKKGAQGYLLKNLQPAIWREYLRAVAVDDTRLSKELAKRILLEFTSTAVSEQPGGIGLNPLSSREQEVLEHVAKGYANREIAERLYISEHTVKNHLKHILQKLHLQNRVQLTRYAYERGWMERGQQDH